MIPTYQSEIQIVHRFYSRALNNFRCLRIYLPPSYHLQPDRHYPVLYMHDGQNIFSGDSSYSGAGWEIHHAADELIARRQMQELIIVGIDHQNDQRLSEFAHTDGSFNGHPVKGKGLKYESFLIEDVKPYIESNYRALPGPENTALMGSSMGGLVTFNIGLRHPKVFGKLGVLSPSFWWGGDATLRQVRKLTRNHLPKRMWIDIGDAENHFGEGFTEVVQTLLEKGIKPQDEMACWVIPGGIHSETDWMHRVHCPLLYFFGEVGFPERMELHGRDLIGVRGSEYRINPVAIYSSGFCITPHPVQFESSRPDILTVDPNYTLRPHQPGETVLTAGWEHLRISRRYAVTEFLSQEVTITVEVTVPEETAGESVFIGTFGPADHQLEETDEGFTGKLVLKRDSIMNFKFTRGSWDAVERDSSGHDIPSRRILASEDATVHFTVESW